MLNFQFICVNAVSTIKCISKAAFIHEIRLARIFNSPTHLVNIFKEATSVQFVYFLNRLRISG